MSKYSICLSVEILALICIQYETQINCSYNVVTIRDISLSNVVLACSSIA